MNYETLKGELLELRKEVKRIDDFMAYLDNNKVIKPDLQMLEGKLKYEIRTLKDKQYMLEDKVDWLMRNMNDVLKEIFPERSI